MCHAPKSFGTALLEVLLLGLDVATPGKLPRRAGRVELMPTMRRSSPLLLCIRRVLVFFLYAFALRRNAGFFQATAGLTLFSGPTSGPVPVLIQLEKLY